MTPDLPWVNPVGGLGDTLMLSGVLKLAHEAAPERRVNLVTRTKYPPLLAGHPIIAHIGHPPPGAALVATDYWRAPGFGAPGARAFQLLAGLCGLAPPVPERLYVPFPLVADPILAARLPWARQNVLIGPTSDSPRKHAAWWCWEEVTTRLRADGVFVAQAGRRGDPHVRGAYSLLGLTTPREIIGLMPRFDAVLTVDSFLMHAAEVAGVPAVVLWGPTDPRTYGYADHVHLAATPCAEHGDCIAPANSQVYATPCPKGPAHCLHALEPAPIAQAVAGLLARPRPVSQAT